jgi:hypothetical protein
VPKTHKTTLAIVASLLALAASAPLAQAQTGGTTTPTVSPTPTPAPPPPTGVSTWTVYKKATWYGPGFWGETTACGIVLQRTVIGTAHKGLPCGTQVAFRFKTRVVYATVIDRGPYRKGFAWDLTKKAAKRVGFLKRGSGKIAATVNPAS